jgi:hypothetical protein
MHLTGEWFDNLAKNLKANTTGASVSNGEGGNRKGSDLRQSQRVGVRFPAQIMIVEGGKVVRHEQIHVRDVSAMGIGIIHNLKMAPKQQFIIELPLEEGGSRRILCEVKNCRRLADDLFGIGAQFIAAKAFDAKPAASAPAGQGAAPSQTAGEQKEPAEPSGAKLSSNILDARAAEIRRKMFNEA